MLMKCPVCEQSFEGKGAKKYCSLKCQRKARLLREYPKTEKKCLVCGKSFTPIRKNDQKYCSPKCRSHADYIKRKDAIRASNDKWRAENIEHVREQRKERYWKDPEKYREKAKEWRLANPERFRKTRDKRRDDERFDGNREKVLKRDGYKCTQCGTTENLHIHHKDRTGSSPKPNNAPDNLVTLCVNCHAAEHSAEVSVRMKGQPVTVICQRCGKQFNVPPNRYANGRGKYCSRECRWPNKK